MSKLQVSPAAQRDLQEIKSYIASDLDNPTAALSIVKKITKRIRGLLDHPLMGAPLSSVCNADNDERFLVSGKYLIFYRVSFATVYKGNIIKNLIMDCQSYTKYRPNETTGGIFVSWRRKEELPTGA